VLSFLTLIVLYAIPVGCAIILVKLAGTSGWFFEVCSTGDNGVEPGSVSGVNLAALGDDPLGFIDDFA
jgi:hypothetical protein